VKSEERKEKGEKFSGGGVVEYLETADIETSSDAYARRFDGRVGEWFLWVQERASLGMLAAYPNAAVLDVGGGHGQLTSGLVRGGFRTVVLGSSEECKARIRPWVDSGEAGFVVGDFLEMPFPDRSFDVVISYRMMAHVANRDRFMSEMARVADKAVIIDYPEIRSVNSLAPYLFGLKKGLEETVRTFSCYRERELLEVFGKLGYRKSDRFPQFFLPMVLHRKLNQPGLSSGIENFSRALGLTSLFGSPVILKVERAKKHTGHIDRL